MYNQCYYDNDEREKEMRRDEREKMRWDGREKQMRRKRERNEMKWNVGILSYDFIECFKKKMVLKWYIKGFKRFTTLVIAQSKTLYKPTLET